MKDQTAKRLLDAYLACREISEYRQTLERFDYDTNRMFQNSVHLLIAVIGESLNWAERDDATLYEVIPDLRQIIDTRHRIIHGYDSIDRDTIWEIVEVGIPDLERRLRAILLNAGYASELPD